MDRVPARTSIDELRRFFSEFGEIEAGSLVADHATGQFCGYATFLYKSPEGSPRRLMSPGRCSTGASSIAGTQRQTKRKCATAAPEDTGCQINVTRAAALPIFVPKEILSTSSTQSLLGSNSPVAKEISSAKVLICQNATTGAGILGAFPLAAVLPSSPGWNTSDKHSRVAVCLS